MFHVTWSLSVFMPLTYEYIFLNMYDIIFGKREEWQGDEILLHQHKYVKDC